MARLVAVLGVLVVLLLGAGPASAEPPMDVDSRLTDPAGVLADGRAAAQDAVDRLAAQVGIDLHVVLVSSLDAEPDTVWSEETARISGLDSSDVLLAVAVGEGAFQYEWWVDDAYPGSVSGVEDLLATEVEPRLAAGDWSGAVVTLADGLLALETPDQPSAADPPTWTTTTTVVVVGAVAVVLVVAHLLSRRRASADRSR